MIRINLLPYRQYQSRQSFRRVLAVATVTMALLLVALTGYHHYLAGNIKQLVTANAQTRQQVQSLQRMNRQVTANEEKARLLRKKMAIIGGLEESRFRSVALLNEVATHLISDRMWLTSLMSNSAGVEISGIAMDEKTVADFMTRLEESPLFTTVGLKSLKRQTFSANTHLKAFAVTSNWRQTSAAIETQSDGGG
jgi:type IV pilus assembly protein PilN